jgi:hypothetical protein
MPSSSIVAVPDMGSLLAYVATYAQPVFNNFLGPVMIGVGISLAALAIAFIVNALLGGVHWLFRELRGRYGDPQEGTGYHPVGKGHSDYENWF